MIHTENMSSDDDDYVLPSLSERVQAAFKSRNTLQLLLTSDSEVEEHEFQAVSKENRSTPYPGIKCKSMIFTSDSEDAESDFFKCSKKIHSTPVVKMKMAHLEKTPYEDLNGSYIRNYENRQKNHEVKESDSDESFLNSEGVHKNQIPLFQSKDTYGVAESSSDEEFSNIIENISRNKTPITQNKRIYHDKSETDSDGTFSSLIKNLSITHLPKSQKKNGRNHVSSISEKEEYLSTPEKEATTHKSLSVKVTNEMEYATLFPSKPVQLSFKDQVAYGLKLFKFFNEKIFSSELPSDMPLIWSNSLLKTAGLTLCRQKNGLRSCSIKLSSKLLISFERLQDTLLHEMCHAAVWVISKGNESHGPLWRIWASRCKLVLPFVHCPERCHNYDIPFRVWYQCLKCNWRIGRCKQSQKLHKSVCKKCKTPLIMTN